MSGKIVCIVGPTASGKTGLGIEIALTHHGEVVSADSMQIYRKMNIGTAKPTEAEKRRVIHHMLDVAQPDEEYSVARYVEGATKCVDDILARGKLPIVVGGTGLYLEALIAGRIFAPFVGGNRYRDYFQAMLEGKGAESLLELLRQHDPLSAQRLHPNDTKRIIRALEVYYETGKTITEYNEESRRIPPRYEALTIGLDFKERADLYARIDARVDKMIADGLCDEVAGLLSAGLPRNCTAMQAIGYKELVAALDGKETVEQAVERIKMESRRYAKRQRTWFRRSGTIEWIVWDNEPNMEIARQVSRNYLRGFGVN